MKPKILSTLPGYDGALFRADLVAGISVAMVAIPLCIAIAIASGAEPAAGLTTAIVGGFLISALGGSRVQIGGPTGAFIVVIYNVAANHGYDGLVLATMMAGGILLVAAIFRAGLLVRQIPEAVINGFTIGIAIIIASSQLKELFGLTTDVLPGDFLEKIGVLWQARETFNVTALMIGLTSIGLIVLFRHLAPRFPGLIVAMAITSGAVALFSLPVDTLYGRFGPLPSSPPLPSLPEINFARLEELFPSALVIAFLAGVESLLSATVADRMIGGHYRPNAELIANGAANIGSALFGGLPATGAIARTATNVRAGARTPVAGIVHAGTILAVMMLAGPLAGYLAMPALAGLLLLTAWNMSEPQRWRGYMAGRISDVVLLFLTLALTVLTDLALAIGVGSVLGLMLRMQRRDVPPADWTPPDR